VETTQFGLLGVGGAAVTGEKGKIVQEAAKEKAWGSRWLRVVC